MWSILEDDNLTLLSRNHKTTQEIIKPKNTNYPTIVHLSCPKHRHFFLPSTTLSNHTLSITLKLRQTVGSQITSNNH